MALTSNKPMYYLLVRSPKTTIYDLWKTLPTLEDVHKEPISTVKYKVIHYDEATDEFTLLDNL